LDRRTLLLSSLALAGASLPLARPGDARPAYGTQKLVRLIGNRPGITAYVNGQGPFLFLIDSATSHSVLVPELRERLALPAVPGPAYDVITAAGSVRSHFYQLREVACAGVIVEGGRVVVIDLPRELGIAGVLGADFLHNFTADLDLRTQTLSLYPEGTVLQNRGLRLVRGRLNAYGFIVAPGQVENVAVSAIFDSGAAHTVANPALAASTQRTVKTIMRVNQTKVVDAARQRGWAETASFSRIALGPMSWRARQIMIADMRVFEQIGFSRSPAIFIGMDLMAGRRIVLDYGNATLALAPHDEPVARS
jgi:predicted aspartyl protease